MKVCPDCRAGKEWIESQQETKGLFLVEIDFECSRCGHTETKEALL